MSSVGAIYNEKSSWHHKRWLDLVQLTKSSVSDTGLINKVLDIGCGSGARTKALLEVFPNIETIYAIDPSSSMIETALAHNSDPKIKYIVAKAEDIRGLDLPCFDLVVGNFSLHWVKDIDKLMQLLNFVTHKNSLLLIGTVEKFPEIFSDVDKHISCCINEKHSTPIYLHSETEWEQILKDADWELKICRTYAEDHVEENAKDLLELWHAASTGKGFANKPLNFFSETFFNNLISELKKKYYKKDNDEWVYQEEVLLLVAKRK
jgi:ubiquinone/menaquinone biosynthesis C-methylase UbiE